MSGFPVSAGGVMGMRVGSSGGRVERAIWSGRVEAWHEQVTSSPVQEQMREALLKEASLAPDDRVVDLGAGTGFVALACAPEVDDVLCVDITEQMLDKLRAQADGQGLSNVRVERADLAIFDFPADSVDLVVSNYALHHLARRDKQALPVRARSWLRPGGRIVLSDWMFGRGLTARDWRVLAGELRHRRDRGLLPVLRLARKATAVVLGVSHDKPVSPQAWIRMLTAADFVNVHCVRTERTAGLVTAS
ncbi:MAG: class I SAM-dependent methyltransferase, partial [Streptosporangiales bacterium]